MSAAVDFCSQNPLDDSIPFIAPEPYIITRAVIEQLTAIVDRDIETESRALRLYTVNTNKLSSILNSFPPTATLENAMANPNISAAFNNKKQYIELFGTLSESPIKTYAKDNFIGVGDRFSNKASNFNLKPQYSNRNERLRLHDLEKIAIQNYTKHGDGILNTFLREGGRTYYSLKHNPILEAILLCFRGQFPQGDTNKDAKTYFTFFKLLYNTIAKLKIAYHPTDKYIRVFRGVKSHYLSEDSTRVFYTNLFLSTSYDIRVAEGFGRAEQSRSRNHEEFNIDVFYVHPSCYYCNMKTVSNYSEEKEILITPYCRYVFIKKNTFWSKMTVRGGMPGKKYPLLYTKYYYAVFPTDLAIPASFDGFLTFIRSPPSVATPIVDEGSGERVVVNIVREAPAVACTGAGCGAQGGGRTRRRKSRRGVSRKRIKA